MADEDFVPVEEHTAEEDSPINEHVDMYDGETLFSFPDNTNAVIPVVQAQQMLKQAIDEERRRYYDINKGVLRTNTNKSGAIQFRTYQIINTMGSILIVKEKESRGDTVITNFSTDSIYIGAHPGLVANGSDTVQIAGGASRTIRTRQQLWAITAAATAVQFDVQEEFD